MVAGKGGRARLNAVELLHQLVGPCEGHAKYASHLARTNATDFERDGPVMVRVRHRGTSNGIDV